MAFGDEARLNLFYAIDTQSAEGTEELHTSKV